MGKIVVIASGNAHKVEEFNRLARAANLRDTSFVAAREMVAGGMPEVEENADSFVGNARLKAAALRKVAPREAWVLADDSGLCVDALGGAPGVKTARYAGENSTAAENRAKLLAALAGVPATKRGARFVCALLLISPDNNEQSFSATCEGEIADHESDAGFGFGYDPIFVPRGFSKTFAELPGEIKDALSHRGNAFAKLAKFLATTGN
ncbi:MAG: RdgB/HAM1 family non-canonical purine NTP pyrophosphatase [Opitutae bacterium]|nr:RdgB/HAM1 family non-canonical purine NTP pyrophosphatase [Opitutae bacterium]